MKTETYQIEGSRHLCVDCSGEIACGESYYSAVLFVEDSFRRQDYCASCWREAAPDAEPDGGETTPSPSSFFAFWKARRPPATREAPRLRFDPQLVLEFFRRLSVGAGGPGTEDQSEDSPAGAGENAEVAPAARRELRVVLALLLIRKKLLNFESSVEHDGAEWLRLSEKKDGKRTYWVENPELTDAELESARDSLGELLQMNL